MDSPKYAVTEGGRVGKCRWSGYGMLETMYTRVYYNPDTHRGTQPEQKDVVYIPDNTVDDPIISFWGHCPGCGYCVPTYQYSTHPYGTSLHLFYEHDEEGNLTNERSRI